MYACITFVADYLVNSMCSHRELVQLHNAFYQYFVFEHVANGSVVCSGISLIFVLSMVSASVFSAHGFCVMRARIV